MAREEAIIPYKYPIKPAPKRKRKTTSTTSIQLSFK
jgi:hypothetical protein